MNIIPVKKGGIYSVELSFKDQEKIEILKRYLKK